MIKKIVTLACLCIAFSTQAITLDELQQRFSQQPTVRAEFTQERMIKGMQKPLKSSGKLIISREKGLWWQQQKPFPLTLVLDDKRMVQVMAAQAPQTITAESNPQMFQFNHLLRALFQADRAVLEQNFALDFSSQANDQWALILTPKTSPLDKLFNTITLRGGIYLENIVLDDRQGDSTTIFFTQQRLTPEALSHDEQQLFVY